MRQSNILINKPKQEKASPKPIAASAIRLPGITISRETAHNQLFNIMFIVIWAFFYIANRHYGERTLAKMDKLRKEVKDLKADYQTINAERSNKSMQSEVVKEISKYGIKALTTPPQKLIIAQSKKEVELEY
ncbi:MAG: FtsL-like putative cell division protein [Bacteroidota bacterium]|nr:FtsL-like putative cell division protein [Bacteroidota bacterium]